MKDALVVSSTLRQRLGMPLHSCMTFDKPATCPCAPDGQVRLAGPPLQTDESEILRRRLVGSVGMWVKTRLHLHRRQSPGWSDSTIRAGAHECRDRACQCACLHA